MKLWTLRIQNFRSFEDETIYFSDYNCFVGPNGSGKSTILTALNIFFRNPSGSADIVSLSEEDFHLRNTQAPVNITATFTDLSNEANNELKAYSRQNQLIVKAKATWNPETQKADIKQYGARLVMKEFTKYFKADKDGARAGDLKKIYSDISKKFSDLPNVTVKGEMEKALRDFEETHGDLCVLEDSEDQFYGWSKGSNKLGMFCQWVYIPAVKDASEEQQEGKNTALGALLQRTIRLNVNFEERIKNLRTELGDKYRDMVDGEKSALKNISGAIQKRLQEWAHPNTSVDLNWFYDPDKSVSVNEPYARVSVGEGTFLGEITRMGHGLQRSFIVSLLQEQAETHAENQPTLILGFEEPELYQHPPQARHLAFVLEQLSEDNAQVLVTTHSPYFISGRGFESVRMTRRVGKSEETKVSLVSPDELSESLSKAMGEPPRSPSSVMAAVEQIMQPSQNELFFSRVPILVEGIEDIAYISTQFKLTGRWSEFRRLGCHFVVTGGKTNMSRSLAIANGLCIPAFVIFDGDGDCAPINKETNIRDNGCILNLCGHTDIDAFPSVSFWGIRLVMWATRIGKIIHEEIGEEWDTAEEEARQERGFTDGVRSKNTLLIAATLEKLYGRGRSSPILDKLCNNILIYGNRVQTENNPLAKNNVGE